MKITAKTPETSHVDHMSPEALATVLSLLASGQSTVKVLIPGALAIAEVTLPDNLDSVLCALRGPTTGEAPVSESDVFYGVRGEGRPNLSRMTNLPATQSRIVTVIVVGLTGEGDEYQGNLATAYGGPLAPQEPGDPYLAPENLPASEAFWAEHALSVDGSPKTARVDSATFVTFVAPEASQAAAKAANA